MTRMPRSARPAARSAALLLLTLASMVCAAPARAAEPIRVAILGDARSVEVGGGPTKISDLAGQPVSVDTPTWLRVVPKRGGVEVRGHGAAPAVRLSPVGSGPLRVNGREYPGALEIAPGGDGLVVINEVPLEDYVAGAVKAEAGDFMPAEMLKAQAIVARTYVAYH